MAAKKAFHKLVDELDKARVLPVEAIAELHKEFDKKPKVKPADKPVDVPKAEVSKDTFGSLAGGAQEGV